MVRNAGVARYDGLENLHLSQLGTDREDDDLVCLHVETNQSRIRISQAARTRLFRDHERLDGSPELVDGEGSVALHYTVDVEAGDETVVEKVVSIFTSRDAGISEPGRAACDLAHAAPDFDELLESHVVSWRHLWDRTRTELGADGLVAQAVNLHVFHLMQTVSNNTVGVGHVFWDELFILPFLSLRLPQLSRALLLYRYHRLDRARRNAIEAGYIGSMFPWQSGSDGREETQTAHLNPISRRWLPDASHLQRHVNAAIAYNTWQYFQATGDREFLSFYGAEMILEIARFWASIATYDHALDRYEIKTVMGPDEYHDAYPDRSDPGLDNNAYTNLMAVWCLCRALDTLDAVPSVSARELKERLQITSSELDRWDDVSRKMRLCFHDGVISQFEGYERLEELDLDGYREKYGDISRLDRILESEGDSTNRYRVAKQADVTMLLYLLAPDELTGLLERLGYPTDDELIARCVRYYEPRTVHGSTLSRVVQAWVHAHSDVNESWQVFREALRADIDDPADGTTKEGIHLGAMAGTVDLIQRVYAGIETHDDMLRLNPRIPVELGSLRFDIRYHGNLVHLELKTDLIRARVDPDEGVPITIEVAGTPHIVQPGELLEIPLDEAHTRPTGILG
jgi:alpha,alpha-trehalase